MSTARRSCPGASSERSVRTHPNTGAAIVRCANQHQVATREIASCRRLEDTQVVQHRENAKLDLLKRVPLFAGLSVNELSAVAAAAEESKVPVGETLLSQEEPGREVVVLLDGAATVERDGEVVGTAGPGDVVGEIGVLTRMSRT